VVTTTPALCRPHHPEGGLRSPGAGGSAGVRSVTVRQNERQPSVATSAPVRVERREDRTTVSARPLKHQAGRHSPAHDALRAVHFGEQVESACQRLNHSPGPQVRHSSRPAPKSPRTPRATSSERCRPERFSIQKVRTPTASSPRARSASTQPIPPQHGPRGEVSKAPMIRRALSLGAPVTDPGGNIAAGNSGRPTASRNPPDTVDTRWTRPGCFSTAHRSVTGTEPGTHAPWHSSGGPVETERDIHRIDARARPPARVALAHPGALSVRTTPGGGCRCGTRRARRPRPSVCSSGRCRRGSSPVLFRTPGSG
jgi:hypothetical protein